MNESKPIMIWWKMQSGVLLSSLLQPSDDAKAKSSNRCVIRAWRPTGACAWATGMGEPWRDLADLPPEWGLNKPDDLDWESED